MAIPWPHRPALGGYVYHVLSRANARLPIFESPADFDTFERVLEEAVERYRTRILAYAIIPARRDWHLVVWPRKDGELSQFVGGLTLTHTQRWHAHRHSVGSGHVCQGRFKSFVVQSDGHLYAVCRYVERNPLRANLARKAEDWRWPSLHRFVFGKPDEKRLLFPKLETKWRQLHEAIEPNHEPLAIFHR